MFAFLASFALTQDAEVAQPGTARAWRVRGALHLGSSNLPRGTSLIKLKPPLKRGFNKIL